MFEYRSQSLLPRRQFILRVAAFALLAMTILMVSLGIGNIGYHVSEGMSWTESLLNASMILGGMGSVSLIQTEAGKIIASFYALFSGVIFLVAMGSFLAPDLHRLLHRLLLQLDDTSS